MSVDVSPDVLHLVKLRVGGVVFEVEKEILLRVKNTFFCGLLSSGRWQPEADGAYFVDRPAMGFDRIIEYLKSGKLSVMGLSDLEEQCVYSSLDYFLIPYRKKWQYNTRSFIEGFLARYVCELKDGRLCGTYMNKIIVSKGDSNAFEMTLQVHSNENTKVIQLQDCRLCSFSDDIFIMVWNIDSGLCELTLASSAMCLIQLYDGRLCSGSSIRISVWNVSTGVCEMTLDTQEAVTALAQLADGRICSGGSRGIICIHSLLTGECERSWKGHSNVISVIVCIDATRVCSGSYDHALKLWSTASGQRERTLTHTPLGTYRVNSMFLMHDGRLCSATSAGNIKLWNLETGECEHTVDSFIECSQVVQLDDGRLLCACLLTILVW